MFLSHLFCALPGIPCHSILSIASLFRDRFSSITFLLFRISSIASSGSYFFSFCSFISDLIPLSAFTIVAILHSQEHELFLLKLCCSPFWISEISFSLFFQLYIYFLLELFTGCLLKTGDCTLLTCCVWEKNWQTKWGKLKLLEIKFTISCSQSDLF